ncbi:UDP-N-acetylglucosamine 1-carboxyvinyltransferase [Patescibacteria group bacterium]|nr:MAG: UDP-N-acetylglucosamine 1-carboxyvinyltransferase [Patescibacteria group bacterium]
MAHFEITGGRPLSGTIAVSGAKNAALKFLAASLLMDGPVTLTNVPRIEDVRRMVEILKGLGATVTEPDPHQYIIDPRSVSTDVLDEVLAPKIRVSTLLVASLLVTRGAATLPFPGGCAIGRRPIDLFLAGYKAFGAAVEEGEKEIRFSSKKLTPIHFVFPFVSHTVTEALVILGSRVPGETVLENCAMEPEVVALADFLNSCGAKISGAGTPTIRIRGVERLSGGSAEIMPDRIEAGSFLALAAATKSQMTITGTKPEHLSVPLEYLQRLGVPFTVNGGDIAVKPWQKLQAQPLMTHEYPGFPTDIQPPFTVLLTQATGSSMVHETIFEGRLYFTEKLNKMGAEIILCDPHRALVQGPTPLRGTTLESPDIRAGLALVVAALAATGTSKIENIYQIDRGYEAIEERLRALGADITRVA